MFFFRPNPDLGKEGDPFSFCCDGGTSPGRRYEERCPHTTLNYVKVRIEFYSSSSPGPGRPRRRHVNDEGWWGGQHWGYEIWCHYPDEVTTVTLFHHLPSDSILPSSSFLLALIDKLSFPMLVYISLSLSLSVFSASVRFHVVRLALHDTDVHVHVYLLDLTCNVYSNYSLWHVLVLLLLFRRWFCCYRWLDWMTGLRGMSASGNIVRIDSGNALSEIADVGFWSKDFD